MNALVLVALLLLFSLYYFWRKWRYETVWKYVSAIPGPKEKPIIGTFSFGTAESQFLTDRNNGKEFYPIYRMWTLDIPIVGILNPEDIELIINNPKHNTKSYVYELIHEWLGTGLLTSSGQKWQHRRKMLTPAFHFNTLQEYVEVLNNETTVVVNQLRDLCNEPFVNVIKPITDYALNSIAETALGVSLREESNCTKYREAIHNYGMSFVHRAVRPWLLIPFIYKLSSLKRKNEEMIKIMHDFCDNIINNRQINFTPETMNNSRGKRLNLLELMLKAKYTRAEIDDAGIREELNTFTFAGHDTTAMALIYTLMELANQPKIQDELYQEIMSVVDESDEPSYQQLGKLKFMDRCIKECLRLYPSVPVIGRISGEEIKTKTGYVIPNNCFIHIYIYDLHRRPELWENPEKFDPDRFLPENVAKRHPFAYLPFSAGGRNCIGQKFALLEMKTFLCGILRNFKLESVTKPEDIIYRSDIVLRSSTDINVKFITLREIALQPTKDSIHSRLFILHINMFLIVIATLVTVIGFIFWSKKKNEEFWKHFMAIPGPKAYPVIGTEYHFEDSEAMFNRDRKRSVEYFPIYKMYTLGIATVCIMTPEDIELILNNSKHLEKSQIYNLLHDWLGTGLLTSKGQQWHSRRKILTPAFHFTILQEFVHIFNKEMNHLVEDIKKLCDRPYIDVVKPITEFTLHSIGETSLGKDLREDPRSKQYLQAVLDYGDNLMYRLSRPWLYHQFLYKLSSVGRRNEKTIEILHDFSSNIIKERYKLFEDNGQISYTNKKKLALLDLMIKSRNSGADMDDVAMREEVDTFILGGYDTTAVSLSHTLMILANEEKIQEELYQEIIAIVENPNNPMFAELQELKYMERCIKESLRIYPSAHVISRIAGEDIRTKEGYVIPKGCDININIIDMHRSPHLYENPENFDPDRFLPENIAQRHPYAYIPFSAGSRNCIGQKYAMLEMKAVLCGILGNFKLEAVTKPKELRHKGDIIIRPIGEIRVKFVPRK
ncbi:uncharacterized protein LOC130444880 [Diorhabda sublineata]|nr:uncharacterized protein LOC130444880 [Diorhabda sublineata]